MLVSILFISSSSFALATRAQRSLCFENSIVFFVKRLRDVCMAKPAFEGFYFLWRMAILNSEIFHLCTFIIELGFLCKSKMMIT